MRFPAQRASVLVALACSAPLSTAPLSTVLANDIGFYIGGYYGQATKDGDRTWYEAFATDVHAFFGFTPTSQDASFDERDSALAILVGYRVTPHLAFEGSYSELGQLAYKSFSSGNFRNDAGIVDITFESETSGFQISGLGTLPVTHEWELFARVGALFATNRFKAVLVARGEIFAQPGGPRTTGSFSRSSTDYFAGLGMGRRVFEMYDVRLEYQRVFDAGLEETGGAGDIDAILLGITATF